MKTRYLFAILAGAAALLIAAYAVSVRTMGMADLMPTSPFAKLTVPTSEATLPVLAEAMPEFTNIASWLNSSPLAVDDLKGKVVLIDFWTYSCINCIRTLPYVTSWYGKYAENDFVVIGVHTPEFAFEKEEKNVRQAIERHGIRYPVALDNAYGTWTAYGNRYWPAHYLFDAEGRLRYYHFGEGKYDKTEAAIQSLLKENGQAAAMPLTEGTTPDFAKIGSPETYLGYDRMSGLASPETVARDAARTYTFPESLARNTFGLSGTWTVEDERAIPSAGGALRYRYSASAANLVLASHRPDGPALRVEVLLDGGPVPEALQGADINNGEDGTTYLLVQDERLYELTNARGTYGEHLLELIFSEPGVSAYAFTFG
ncbi:MAG: thioredoxin family protein [Patescibacteria group bacterium]|nr:MAG: thioredoxin family protein [Patescibacteria group bacterium]